MASERLQVTLGQRIRITRERKGISQRELGRLAAIGFSHLCHVEAGTKSISLPVLVRIAGVLDVTTDYMLGLARTWQRRGHPITDIRSEEP